jgi:hypothetical protein
MKLLWRCASAPFRVVGWLLLALAAVCAAFDHDDDAGGVPLPGAAQKQHPMLPGGRFWAGERRHR